MRDRIDDLGDRATVALVTFTDAASLTDYDERNHLGFTLLRDPDRISYRAFGLGRGSFGRVWGLRAARRYVEILRADGIGGLRRPTEDPRQLGGDFVIDTTGRLVWGFWGEGPDDRPTVDDLVSAVTRAASR